MGSLYYREFPFGGYCEETPVARGVAFFSSESAYVRPCAICPSCVSIRTRNVPHAAINQNLGDFGLRIYAVYVVQAKKTIARA